MPEVLLSNDDITVLGPPEILELSVDIGPQGQRGSQVFAGNGNPNDPGTVIGQTPLQNDLYINIDPDSDYGFMYQYQQIPGGDDWVEILKVIPAIYSNKFSTSYTAGLSSVTIPISSIATTLSSPTTNNFAIQCTIANTNPVACAISPSVVGGDLVISIKAAFFNGTSWSNLSGSFLTHIFVSVVGA